MLFEVKTPCEYLNFSNLFLYAYLLMKKTKTQQFSKFFLKDLRTKEKIYNKENYLEKSNFPS